MRRRRVPEKEIHLDPKYNSKIVSKFINMVMTRGKKNLAEKIVYGALEIMKKKINDPDGLRLFHRAIENVRPRLEVKPRRVGGATYQVPVDVRQERGNSIALRWLRDFARTKKGKSMVDKLAEELISAYKGEGSCVKKRDDMHKMAESNKAYAHFRW